MPFAPASVLIFPISKIKTEELKMQRINLRDYYSWIHHDEFVDITDEMLETMKAADRQEAAYKRRMYYHKAQYSLDCGDGIENDALFKVLSPGEIYEQKVTAEQLQAALASLPEKQRRRVYAHYILGMKKSEIARTEGVAENSVHATIQSGLRNIKKFLEKSR